MTSEKIPDPATFSVVRDRALLKGTAYFELHPRERPTDACWLDGSLFVRDDGFDFLSGCFHAANSRFDYFSFTRFDENEVRALRTEIDGFRRELQKPVERRILFAQYESDLNPARWDVVSTEDLRVAVLWLTTEVQEFLAENSDLKCLWVLGL